MKAYDALAAVYDRMNGTVDYEAIADFAVSVFRRERRTPELVLDLGCGTGALTFALARRGYDMIGVDGSAEMLAKAYERKMDEGIPSVLLLCQDMCAFELYGTVGAVVSTLDCINYLTEEGDLARCFSLVHNYLDPDGVFLFDVNTPYKFEHVYGDNAYILEDEGEDGLAFCGWQNHYDAQSGICAFDLSIFLQKPDGSYKRSDEQQLERVYGREELTEALVRAGFGEIEFFGDMQFGAPLPDCERWYIKAICKK